MDIKKILAGSVAALTLGAGGIALVAPAVGASTPTPAATASAPGTSSAKHHGHRHLRHRALKGAIVSSAKTIGITPKDLVGQLKAGKSVAEVATAHGVDPHTVVTNLVKAGDARIDKAVEAGKLDATRAAKAKERLPKAAERFVNFKRQAK